MTPGYDRRDLHARAQQAPRWQLRRLLTLCESRVAMFEHAWPALAASWREDAAILQRLIERK